MERVVGRRRHGRRRRGRRRFLLIGDLFDLDEGWAVIVVIVALIGGAVAAFFVVWSAPTLLADLVLDVALVSRLYSRVKHLERRSWLRTAVRKTWVAALVVVLLAAAAELRCNPRSPAPTRSATRSSTAEHRAVCCKRSTFRGLLQRKPQE